MAAQDKYLLCLSQGLQWDLVAGRLGQGGGQGPLLCTGRGEPGGAAEEGKTPGRHSGFCQDGWWVLAETESMG